MSENENFHLNLKIFFIKVDSRVPGNCVGLHVCVLAQCLVSGAVGMFSFGGGSGVVESGCFRRGFGGFVFSGGGIWCCFSSLVSCR